ncbi:MAG: cysteine--tRNA ligase [Bacteroidia bacterium]|nr:cysteine--tRNA ligase [Bacteroidia bacterium]
MSQLTLFNTLSRKKEAFQALNPPFVGMYLCGPTVYGDAHLGHARPAITFDVLYRWLKHSGYKVRYVRNITDVGHLENDADAGEDKIAKKAKVEQLEPMEIAQRYTDNYARDMEALNILRPSIEPRASGHIVEQIEMIQEIVQKGLAYEVNGSVYFDVPKYHQTQHYGKLSGRVIEDLLANTREDLEGQGEKRSTLDFALWKKASPEHIMRWNSPWGEGFPGWHIECSVMSSKYLGNTFDIHGGGMDLLFPHHECEIAQSHGANNCDPARYWVHNNMITINGQKMGKSLGNFITLGQFFTGDHPALEQAYSPMAIRFFILMAHYRSTVDFSNEALQAAEKGLKRLLAAYKSLQSFTPNQFSGKNTALDQESLDKLKACADFMNDDLNTAEVIARLFELSGTINSLKDGHLKPADISEETILQLKDGFKLFLVDILGFQPETGQGDGKLVEGLMQLIIELRLQSRANKDWATSDKIRDSLLGVGIKLKDGKEVTSWEV